MRITPHVAQNEFGYGELQPCDGSMSRSLRGGQPIEYTYGSISCSSRLRGHRRGRRPRAHAARRVVDGSRFQLRQNVGLPAIDEGLIQRDARLTQDRGAASAVRNTPGRVVVKFRDQAPMTGRRAAVRAASDTGEIVARPSYADFDIIRIDPSEDAETAAGVLRQRSEVQYAQVSHRMHALLIPNDPLYLSQQWNFPLINKLDNNS